MLVETGECDLVLVSDVHRTPAKAIHPAIRKAPEHQFPAGLNGTLGVRSRKEAGWSRAHRLRTQRPFRHQQRDHLGADRQFGAHSLADLVDHPGRRPDLPAQRNRGGHPAHGRKSRPRKVVVTV